MYFKKIFFTWNCTYME